MKAQTRHYTPSGRIQSLSSAVSFPIFTQPFSCISYLGILRTGLLLESCRSRSQKYSVAMLTWIHAEVSAVIVKHTVRLS